MISGTHSLLAKGTIETYRTDYRKLLERTKKALPKVKLIIMEPYAVKGVKAVDEKWYPAFNDYQRAAKEIALEFNAVFIPLQTIFDKAQESAPWLLLDNRRGSPKRSRGRADCTSLATSR